MGNKDPSFVDNPDDIIKYNSIPGKRIFPVHVQPILNTTPELDKKHTPINDVILSQTGAGPGFLRAGGPNLKSI